MKGYHFFILLFFILISCSSNHIYEEYTDINPEGWNFKERVYFKFDVVDTASYYDVFLNVRNTGEFDYSNIWLKCIKKSPSGQEINENLEFTLATPDGRWVGNGIGDIIDNQFILEEKVKLKEAGIYTYFINHEMRVDDLKGILNVGISVKKHVDNKNI